MTKTVEIHAWCDMCPEGKQAEAATWHVGLTPEGYKLEPLELDLCAKHFDKVIWPLQQVLDVHGRKVKAASNGHKPTKRGGASDGRQGMAPAGPRDKACPWCELTYASGSGRLNHARKFHPRELADVGGSIPGGYAKAS